ncbi:MAG: aspartate--tRNA(Asn) ligase, partial [Dethiosulfatibacter sp.]|nr:aspartate--tRNA(Asn) ligase [Dethiosulfatibacter sp.]
MERVLVRDLMELEDKEVRLFGWIQNIKSFKGFSFVYLRDRSGIVQMIIDDEKILSSLKL